MRVGNRARWAFVIVAATALVLAAAAAARTHSAATKKPIIIGWAYDNNGLMAPFDGPVLAAAQIEKAKINKKGGILGHQLVIKTCKTQGDDPTVSKTCADKLIGEGAKIIFTTCDVNFGTPVIQEALAHHLLTISPCIGTDLMGPKTFGAAGKLAFSFGNVAQDEGSAMAQFAWKKGWKTADLAKDAPLPYFEAVVNAFEARFTQLGGKINFKATYHDPAVTQGSNDVHNAASAIEAHPAKVIVTVTAGAYLALGSFLTDLRTAHVNTPVLNSWAGDGTYWVKGLNPKVSNYWFVTYANAFGHDPNPAVNKLAKQIHAATGGFVQGPAAIDGIATAIKRANGSLVGSKLAAVLEKFHKVPTISGKVSFSKSLHTVFGRAYRIVEINKNVPIEKGEITAKKVPHSPDTP